jgi:hypothetical protein
LKVIHSRWFRCSSSQHIFTCRRLFPLALITIPCTFLPRAEACSHHNTTSACSASRLTALATLGYDQQVGLDDIIPESYNKVGVSSRTPVEVVSLFHTPVSSSSPHKPYSTAYSHAFQHSTYPQTGDQGYHSTNILHEMPLLTVLSPCRPGRHDVGGLR